MKKLPSSLAARITPVTFLSTTVVALTLLLASTPAYAQLQPYRGQATSILTTNCNSSTSTPPGLCQGTPACNNGSGSNPDNISASITLCECSGRLTGTGTGTGFRPGVTYISLLYKNGTVSTCSRFPAGMTPYVANIPYADNDFGSMMLGIWQVNNNGSATLTVNKQATVSGLNNYTTVSVREMQPLNPGCYQCIMDPAPQLNALRACGTLTVAPTDPNSCLVNCACYLAN